MGNTRRTEGKIEHKKGNLTILVDGVALKSGMQGDYLEVKNENSGKIVKGWVKIMKKLQFFAKFLDIGVVNTNMETIK